MNCVVSSSIAEKCFPRGKCLLASRVRTMGIWFFANWSCATIDVDHRGVSRHWMFWMGTNRPVGWVRIETTKVGNVWTWVKNPSGGWWISSKLNNPGPVSKIRFFKTSFMTLPTRSSWLSAERGKVYDVFYNVKVLFSFLIRSVLMFSSRNKVSPWILRLISEKKKKRKKKRKLEHFKNYDFRYQIML